LIKDAPSLYALVGKQFVVVHVQDEGQHKDFNITIDVPNLVLRLKRNLYWSGEWLGCDPRIDTKKTRIEKRLDHVFKNS
jgi:hypothetical protein